MIDAERMKTTERVRGLGYKFSHMQKVSTHGVKDERVGVLVYEDDLVPEVDYLKCALEDITRDFSWYIADRLWERRPIQPVFPVSTFRGEFVCNARVYKRSGAV